MRRHDLPGDRRLRDEPNGEIARSIGRRIVLHDERALRGALDLLQDLGEGHIRHPGAHRHRAREGADGAVEVRVTAFDVIQLTVTNSSPVLRPSNASQAASTTADAEVP